MSRPRTSTPSVPCIAHTQHLADPQHNAPCRLGAARCRFVHCTNWEAVPRCRSGAACSRHAEGRCAFRHCADAREEAEEEEEGEGIVNGASAPVTQRLRRPAAELADVRKLIPARWLHFSKFALHPVEGTVSMSHNCTYCLVDEFMGSSC